MGSVDQNLTFGRQERPRHPCNKLLAGRIVKNIRRHTPLHTPTSQPTKRQNHDSYLNDMTPITNTPEFSFTAKNALTERHCEIKAKYQRIAQCCKENLNSRNISLSRKQPQIRRNNTRSNYSSNRSSQSRDSGCGENASMTTRESHRQAQWLNSALPKVVPGRADSGPLCRQLKHQLNLDGKLRALKHRLNHKNIDRVKEILTAKKVPLEKYHLSVEEFDPFMVELHDEDPQNLSQAILKALEECDDNWNKRIIKSFVQEEVEFLYSKLDFEREGELTLKSFVRQMSMVLNMNLRKRDLFCLFRRMTSDGSITKHFFLEFLTAP